MGARISILTAGHLATCPRMVKAADALADAGHAVHVFSTSFLPWARAADDKLAAKKTWTSTRIAFERSNAPGRWLRTRLGVRAARRRAHKRGASGISRTQAVHAYAPYHRALVAAAKRTATDFVYGGTSGALAATRVVARSLGVPFGLDLEDFHVAEQEDSSDARLDHALVDGILQRVVPEASVCTAAGAPIAAAFEERYGVPCVPINNVFPRLSTPLAAPAPSDTLRLYWFSQTLGPGRGLEDVVAAAGRAAVPISLTLRGRALPGYIDTLQSLVQADAPNLSLTHLPPGPPDAMVSLCEGFDVGLALEQVAVPNRDICLTNKLFAFIAAGLPIIGTATTAQTPILESLGPGAAKVPPGNVAALALALCAWYDVRGDAPLARQHVADAAQTRWYWEHPDERGQLIRSVEGAFA